MPEQQQMSPEEVESMKEKIKNMSPEELKEFQMKQCIFCQIISGKIQAKKVYEDEHCIGILDINPGNPGHVLLLPKEHYSVMPQMPKAEVEHLFMAAKFISGAVLRAIEATGVNLIVANGPAAGQRAQHFMIHILPRKDGDGVEFVLPQKKHSESDLKLVADKIKQRISGLLKVKSSVSEPQTANIQAKEPPKQLAHESPKSEPASKKIVEADVKEELEGKTTENNPVSKKKKKTPRKKKAEGKSDESTKEIKDDPVENNDDPSKDNDPVDLDDIARILG